MRDREPHLLCFWRRPAALACVAVTALAGCGRPQPAGPPDVTGPEAGTASEASGNPFAGIEQYRAPYSIAENARNRIAGDNPDEAALLSKIVDQPQASWFGDWNQSIQTAVGNYVNAAALDAKLAVLVAYNVPGRDCGQYSAGGASDDGSYLEWVGAFAAGIGKRRAVVILEPDAVPLLTQCLSEPDQEKRLSLIRQAVETLQANPGTSVYIDAGHSSWVEAGEMAARLKKAGIERARGFALNTSNYQADADLIAYGKAVIQALALDTHFIVDSSRNGNGPAPQADESWCNPEGRALGRRPGTDSGDPSIDAFVWAKRPGESDGTCRGGPPAGQWFHERAVEMARNAAW